MEGYFLIKNEVKKGKQKMKNIDSQHASDQSLITDQTKLTVNDCLVYDQKWLNTLTKVPERESCLHVIICFNGETISLDNFLQET